MKKVRLLLVDDHAVLRVGLRLLLDAQPDFEVVGEAGDGVEAVRLAADLSPDVVLMDLTLPGLGGLDAIRRVKQDSPAARVLVLTMHDDETYIEEAFKAGAAGYVVKKAADTELLAAIRTVARGEMFLHPSLAGAVVRSLLREGQADGPEPRLDPLSERETEVLRLIALGHSNREIAARLSLSVKTVETHKARIMEKLGLRGRAELVRYALARGMIG